MDQKWTPDHAYAEACQAHALAMWAVLIDRDALEISTMRGVITPEQYALAYGEKYGLVPRETRNRYLDHPHAFPIPHIRRPLTPRTLAFVELYGVVGDERIRAALTAAGLEPLPFSSTHTLDPERGLHMGGQHSFEDPEDVCTSCGYASGVVTPPYCEGCRDDMKDNGELELPDGDVFRVEQLNDGLWVCFLQGEPVSPFNDNKRVFDKFKTRKEALSAWVENQGMEHSPCGCCMHWIDEDGCQSGAHGMCNQCEDAEEA